MLGLDGGTVPGSRALDRLAERLESPGFNWEALLAEHARGQGGHFWMPEDDALLRRGWRARDPLGVLADWLDVGEVAVVDWIIDLGPEGGSGGGTIVAEGSSEQVAEIEVSHTGQLLARVLSG